MDPNNSNNLGQNGIPSNNDPSQNSNNYQNSAFNDQNGHINENMGSNHEMFQYSSMNAPQNGNQSNNNNGQGNNSNNTNFLDFDFNDCDFFNNNNNQGNHYFFDYGMPNHQNNLNNNNNNNNFVYLAPKKYEYLGQKEEQIYQDSKAMMNIPDFDFGGNFFNGSSMGLTANSSFNHNINQLDLGLTNCNSITNNNPRSSNNCNNNNNTNNNGMFGNTNNLLFSTFNNNNAVDIIDLFPEPTSAVGTITKQENFMDSDYSPSLQPARHIIPSSNGNHTNNSSHNQSNYAACSSNPNQDLLLLTTKSECIFSHPQSSPFHNNEDSLPGSSLSNGLFEQPLEGAGFKGDFSSKTKNIKKITKSQSLNSNNNVFQIVRGIQKTQRKDYDKNICRYITRQAVRSFASLEFKSKVLSIISEIYPDAPSHNILSFYKDVTDYFLGEIENLSGFRALKDILLINTEIDGEILAIQKRIFRDFLKWYLKERYFRSILSGNMNDKLAFIRYKNKIMLHYIIRPHTWNSNKKKIIPAVTKSSSAIINKVEY